jgi:predicted nucleotidyltransferase
MDIKSWLPNNIIYLSLSGSRAYKTHTEDSDYDYKGACIAPASYYLGMDRFDQSDSKETVEFIKPYLGSFPPDDDVVVYNLVKMISLTADGNPNMIEMVYVEPSSIVYRHPIMNRFFDIRDAFLSRNLKHRFSGYAMSQLKKMRNHKHWIDHPPVFPTREMYGIEGVNLPKDQIFAVDKLIELQVGEWLVDETELPESTKIQLGPQMVRMVNVILEQLQIEHHIGGLRDILDRAATRHLGFSSDFLQFLQKYKAYKSALAEWHSFERWKTQRNPERLKLEMQCGFDAKDAYSLYRLLRMCREILETGKVNVSREGIDADELRDLRHYGNKKYEDIIAWAEAEDKALDEVMKTSPLPKSPNRKLINETLTEVMSEYLFAGKRILPNVESLMAYYQEAGKEPHPVGRQSVVTDEIGVIPVEDKYLKLTKVLHDRGWVRTSEPNFNFYQDPQDGGLGPNQEVTWTRQDKSIIITTDYTLRDVISVRRGKSVRI